VVSSYLIFQGCASSNVENLLITDSVLTHPNLAFYPQQDVEMSSSLTNVGYKVEVKA